MTRVVHIHRIRGIGGSERHVLTLLPALAAEGIEPVFLGLDDLTGRSSRSIASSPSSRSGWSAPRSRSTARAEGAAELGRLRPDVVHTHLVHADVYGALERGAASRSSRPSTTTTRSGAGPSGTSSAP